MAELVKNAENTVNEMIEKWSGSVAEVTIGATKASGGTRSKALKAGGEKGLPFLFKEGSIPNKPLVAFEIWDIEPQDWPKELVDNYGTAVKDPVTWAKLCVDKFKADILCVKLQGSHPDFSDKTPQQEAKLIEQILKAVDVPLIITGSGDDQKDNLVLPACCEAAKKERCVIGSAVQDNYKTLVAAVLADGHNIIAESPIDVNIAKQLNILMSDMGLAFDRILINPTIGALGYGLEYAYSIMERARLAALAGDKSVGCPFICFIGQEAWRTKEAKEIENGVIWETVTASALVQAGGDILVMRHPKAVEKIKGYIDNLMKS